MPACAKLAAGGSRQVTQREQVLNASRFRVVARLGMKLGPLRSDLAHVAQHQQARARQASQHVDGSAHGIGIGVVGVVHQCVGTTVEHARQRPRATFDGFKRFQPARDGCQRHASGQGAGNGRQGILHVVQTGHMQLKSQRADRCAGTHLPRIHSPDRCGADNVGNPVDTQQWHVWRRCACTCTFLCISISISSSVRIRSGVWRNGKRQLGPLPGQCVPHRRKGIVLRKHCNAIGGQRLNHSAIFSGDGFQGGHELQMLALGIVHQRHCGPGHAGQQRNLAGVVHAQLKHGYCLACAQPQQRQRHANVIVEVALRGQHAIGRVSAQDGGDHLRHRGLPIAACDSNQRQLEL